MFISLFSIMTFNTKYCLLCVLIALRVWRHHVQPQVDCAIPSVHKSLSTKSTANVINCWSIHWLGLCVCSINRYNPTKSRSINVCNLILYNQQHKLLYKCTSYRHWWFVFSLQAASEWISVNIEFCFTECSCFITWLQNTVCSTAHSASGWLGGRS